MMPRIANVKIRQFWTEKRMEVPSLFFSYISSTIYDKNENLREQKIKFINHMG
jgi:hypothetical protein